MKKIPEIYFEKCSASLSNFCFSLCRNNPDSEDLFQDTWIKAIEHIEKYDETQPFERWLFKVCANTYKNSCRSAIRRKAVIFKTNEDKDAFFALIEDKNTFTDSHFDLINAIEMLPVKYKIIITLKYSRDFTEKEISEILVIPEGTVKSRLYKARSLLKRRLET